MKNKRKRLWGVWLSNRTDHRDDEWVGIMAQNEAEARRDAQFNSSRFNIKDVAPAKEFCSRWGIPRSWLRRP